MCTSRTRAWLQVALCTWRRPSLTPLVRSSAALAALAGIRSALLLVRP